MDKRLQANLKRRVQNRLTSFAAEPIYLTEERDKNNTKIASVYFIPGTSELRVVCRKYNKKSDNYVEVKRFQARDSIGLVLDFISDFIG